MNVRLLVGKLVDADLAHGGETLVMVGGDFPPLVVQDVKTETDEDGATVIWIEAKET
jgi:hypothetical protein